MIERKTLYKNKWISIRSVADKEKGIPPYYYKHIETSDGQTVAVLPYRWKFGKPEFLVMEELRPPWDTETLTKRYLSSITGCIEDRESPIRAAMRELTEETPYKLYDYNALYYLGDSFITKSSDTVVHQFVTEVLNTTAIGEVKGDGSHMEATATPMWISLQDAVSTKDPLIAQMVLKFCFMMKIKFG